MIERWLNISGNKSLLLIGVRRAGKTTLLKKLFPEAKYITLDDFDFLQIAEQDPKDLFLGSDHKLVVIDEIQRVPRLLIAVKDRIDNYRQIVLMTGSSTLGLLSSSAETLAGRIKIFECPTLCYGEDKGPNLGRSLEHKPNSLEIKEASRELSRWMRFGGFPEVVDCNGNEQKLEILQDYKNTFFTRDLMFLTNIENFRGLLGCLNFLGVSTQSRVEISSIAKESGLSHPTAKKYLNVLEASRIIFRLTGYQYGSSKRQLKSSKYYFADISIPMALNLQLSEGQLFELLVISELEKRRKLGRFDCDFFYYYKSEKGREIDLIIDEGSMVTAIEIKTTQRPERSDVKGLIDFQIKKKVPLRKILICRSQSYAEIDGVEIWPVYSLYRTL